MDNTILKEQLEKCCKNLKKENSLFVYKGFSKESINNFHEINPDVLFDNKKNKTKKWVELISNDFAYLSYEEFLYFYKYIIDNDYQNIYIINNNIYSNFYPLSIDIPQKIKDDLVDFYDEDSSIDNCPIISKGDEYTYIYSNIIKVNETFFATYSDVFDFDPKIKLINLFDEDEYDCFRNKYDDKLIENKNIINIQEDVDYLILLDKFIHVNENIYFRLDYYNDNLSIKNNLCILSNIFGNIHRIETIDRVEAEPFEDDKNFIDILKQYWGYDKFRTLKVYDTEVLQQGEKKVKTISQIDIIKDIVHQVELLQADRLYDCKDIFVTAPTGAGKSVMFQIPAIYLAEKYNLVTLVISPLIGLMKDQVYNLEEKGYKYSRTINSDISPIEKDEIFNDIKTGKCHILYLSPESLLAKSDISQIIGDREIGMVVIDEAHIVTTWGKQFRPDYWYLGDHIRKLRKYQRRKEGGHDFLLSTFTATAIHGGPEDMYLETITSLNMHIPNIKYLGYVKRNNIDICIKEQEAINKRIEYEIDKYKTLKNLIENATIRNKKVLIYFPTVSLIDKFYNDCINDIKLDKIIKNNIVKYYAPMDKEEKDSNYELYKTGQKSIMLATKAFGMGIDIKDIAIVGHYAPTGNVCDYVQEIGRAARDESIQGEARYTHMSNDFKYINRLHGLSAIRKYQLVNVIKKVYELFQAKISMNNSSNLSKKRNTLLIDAENFTYIFKNPQDDRGDDSDLINKVKTALLLIEKDFQQRYIHSPIAMRPAPLFQKGYFYIPDEILPGLKKEYGNNNFELCESTDNIYVVNMENIWQHEDYFGSYEETMSFPKFKYFLYSGNDKLSAHNLNKITASLKVKVEFTNNPQANIIKNAIFRILNKAANQDIALTIESDKTLKNKENNISNYIQSQVKGISRFKADSIANILIATINNFERKNYNKTLNGKISICLPKQGINTYRFSSAVSYFEDWVKKTLSYIEKLLKKNVMYLTNHKNDTTLEEVLIVLGLLESIGYLNFEAIGGVNSQIYIKVNQTKELQAINDKPQAYNNKLLNKIAKRHEISVKMLEYIYQNKFDSPKIWDLIEDYFLGKLPKELSNSLEDKIPARIIYEGGSHKNESYIEIFDYMKNEITEITQKDNLIFDKMINGNDLINTSKPYTFPELSFDSDNGNEKIMPDLAWIKSKVLLFLNYNRSEYEKSKEINWYTFYIDENFEYDKFIDAIKGEL